LAVAAILVVLVMRVVNIGRYKDLLVIVGGLVLIFVSFFGSMLLQKVPENIDDMQNFFASQTGLVDLIGSRFPPGIWATRGLAEGGLAGLGYFLLFLTVSIVLILFLLWISNLVFYKALLAGQEVRRKRKQLSGVQMDRKMGRETSPVLSLFKREWKLMIRTPLYVLNGLVGSVTGPLILVMMILVQGSDPELAEMLGSLKDPEIVPYAALVTLGIMLFTAGMNVVASTAVSREGRTIWIAKMIPVEAKQQVRAKFLCGCAVSSIGVLATSIIMAFFLKSPLLWIVGATLAGLAGTVPMTVLSLMIDVFHPKLIWNSEQEAMKQNMNSLLGMLASFAVMLVLGAAAGGTLLLSLPVEAAIIAVFVVSVILGAILLAVMDSLAEKKYREIEA